MKNILTIREVSTIYGLAISTIHKYKAKNGMPYMKVGGKVRFSREKLNDWWEKHSVN